MSVDDCSLAMPHRNFSLRDEFEGIKSLHDPLFIVAPVGVLATSKLKLSINTLCEQYQFSKKDILLIEEMDLLAARHQQLNSRVIMLEQLGFQNVKVERLGFDEGCIGYLPIDKWQIELIKGRFEVEISKLLDSYNLSLDNNAHYHLAYISSDTWVTGSQVFIANNLLAAESDKKDSNFIFVIRQLDDNRKEKHLVDLLSEFLMVDNEDFCFPGMFSVAKIYVVNPEDGRLLSVANIHGQGTHAVNIFLTSHLPKNIFEDFICLAHSGMASGDQSLGEFLSLTGKIPYYDVRPWKAPLVNALKKMARDIGGEELEQEIKYRAIGRQIPFSDEVVYDLRLNSNQSSSHSEEMKGKLDQKVCTRTADKNIRDFLNKDSV